MANIYYNPTGNPGTGSEGLSSLMRTEFALIGTAFDLVPQISTTGLFTTVFAQVGSYTFTLPSADGTLATTANIATETTRATAAEGVNAAAISAETTARTTAVSTETTRAQTAEALLAPKASPAMTGVPTAPTAAPGTNTTQVATTAFSTAAIAVETARATTAEALLAPKASPAMTGVPTAPTAAPGTNTTQVATTAFSAAAILVETTRATAAEATKQDSLGFTPVQQGGGTGQGTNKVYLGWDGTAVAPRIQIDGTDLGSVAMRTWVTSAISAAVPAATWHNVGGSRASGTTYTNSNSYDISVLVVSSAVGGANASVGGVTVAQFGSNISTYTLAFKVPAGSTYSVSATSITTWYELY